jgi:protocatechuate 3,4-dioxygenase alpha subunit
MAGPSRDLRQTPSQTAGPYVHLGLAPGRAGLETHPPELGRDIAGPGVEGERIRVAGRIIDGMGAPVRDALVEIWQADAHGHHAHPDGGGPVAEGFRGWGRAVTDFETGVWEMATIKPGASPARGGGMQAPHLSLWIVARGINIGLVTRMYFDDEAAANAADPVLNQIEWAHRRETLIARRGERDGAQLYTFDIRLQGAEETVFFDV